MPVVGEGSIPYNRIIAWSVRAGARPGHILEHLREDGQPWLKPKVQCILSPPKATAGQEIHSSSAPDKEAPNLGPGEKGMNVPHAHPESPHFDLGLPPWLWLR